MYIHSFTLISVKFIVQSLIVGPAFYSIHVLYKNALAKKTRLGLNTRKRHEKEGNCLLTSSLTRRLFLISDQNMLTTVDGEIVVLFQKCHVFRLLQLTLLRITSLQYPLMLHLFNHSHTLKSIKVNPQLNRLSTTAGSRVILCDL